MKRIVCCLALAALLLTGTTAGAQERGRVVFQDTLYGVLTGALIGGALTLATDDPGSNLQWVGLGAAVGAVAGAAYGLYETTAVAEVGEDGRLRLAMPSVQLRARGKSMEPSVDVLRLRF